MGSNETATKPKRWLNGWRRMGIVLYVIYCVSPGFSLWDEVSSQRGHLFFDEVPQQAAQPSAQKQLKPREKYAAKAQGQANPFDQFDTHDASSGGAQTAQPLAQERKLMPWEEEWDYTPPTVHKFSFRKLFVTFLGTPLLVWFFVEVFVLAIRWIRAGFRTESES